MLMMKLILTCDLIQTLPQKTEKLTLINHCSHSEEISCSRGVVFNDWAQRMRSNVIFYLNNNAENVASFQTSNE